MTQRAQPRVVLLPAIRQAKSSLLRGYWLPSQLADFLAAADDLGLRFESLPDADANVDGGSRCTLVFDAWEQEFLRHAWPVLQDLDGTFGLVLQSAGIGQSRRQVLGDRRQVPAWSDMKALTDLGVDVVSGGHEGYDLASLAPEVMFGELLRSRCEIERRLGLTPRGLRYPYGRVDARVAAVAADAGFQFGLALRGAVDADPMRCAVMRPMRWESPSRFARRIQRVDRRVGSVGVLAAESEG